VDQVILNNARRKQRWHFPFYAVYTEVFNGIGIGQRVIVLERFDCRLKIQAITPLKVPGIPHPLPPGRSICVRSQNVTRLR
jgi:hypothetical protein